MRKIKLFLTLLMLMCIGVTQMWGAEESYAIAFKSTTTSNDGSQAQTAIVDLISSGSDYVSSVTATKCYNGKSGYGIKVGASSGSSSIVLNLSSGGQVKPTKVVINACRYGTDTGNMNVTLNTGSATTKTLTSSLADYECTMDGNTTLTKITIAPTTKRIYVKSVTVTYTTGGDPDPVLESIAISGTPSTKTYDEGDAFDITGLTVTGSYDIGDDAAITEGITWEARTSAVADDAAALNAYTLTAGQTALQVRATVSEIASSWFDVTGLTVNEHVVTPGEYDITPNNAFWGTSYSGNPPSGSPTSFSASKYDITVQYNKGSGSYLYINDSQTRIYPKNTLVISVPTGYNITSIVFAGTFNNTMTPSVGEYTSSTKTWEGKANSVTFTGGGTSGNNQCTKITVTYAAIAPEVTVDPASLSFTAKQNIAVEGKKFTLEGANLTNGLSLAASTGFSVSPTEITAADAMAQGGVEVTVTPATPTETTTPVEGTVTISGGGLSESVEVALSMAVTPTYAVAIAVNDGNMGSATINNGAGPVYAEYADDVNLVATPESGYEFVSWSASNDDIEIADVSSATTTATIGAAGTITATFQAQACTGLAAPVLDEITKTYQSATIAWNAVDNADGYVLNIVKHEGSVAVLTDEIIVAPAVSFEKTGLDANTQYDYTVMAVGDGTSYCDESNPTLAGSFTTSDYPAATLSLVENGGTPYNFPGSHKLNDVVTLPSTLQGLGCTGKVLVGWTNDEDFADTDDEPTSNYWAKGADYTIVSTADKLYAVLATVSGGDWSKVEIASISEEDVIVVAGVQDGTNYYGLSSANGTSGSPTAVALTVEENTITEGVVDAIKWNLKGTSGNYTLYANGTDNYLYNTAATTSTSGTNTAWRVGQPTSGTIRKNLEVSGTTLRTNEGSNQRYLCQFNNADWRGYVNNTSTNAKTTLAFFKQSSSTTGYTTECEAQLPVLAAPTFPVAEGVFYENTDITILAADGASIYYTTDGTTPSSTNGTLYEGAITLNAYGTYNFKAIAVQAGHEDSEVAEATYYFGKEFASVSALYSYLEANSLTELNNVKVTGVVSRITFPWDETKITYYISDNGQIENDLQMFKGAGTGADVLAVGDQVTVTGNYLYYTGGSTLTHEFGAGNTIVARTAKVHASYAIEGELTASSFNDGDAFDAAILNNLTVKETFNTGYYENVAGVTFNAGDKTAWTEGETELTVNAVLNEETIATKTFTGITVSGAQLSSIALKADDENYSTKVVYYLGETFVAPTIVATLDDESSYEAAATLVSGFDNENAGGQVVTVSYTRGDVTKEVSYNITMKAIFNTLATAYDVTEAKYIIENVYASTTESTDSMFVSGIVVNNPNSDGTYYISVDGNSANQLQVYKGKYFSKTVSAKDNIKAGDEVIVRGLIQVYSNAAELKYAVVMSQLREPEFAIADIVAGDEFEANVSEDMTVVPTVNSGDAEFTLTSGNEAVVTIVENKLHAVAEGDAVITASRAATNNANALNYKAKEITFNVHVIAERTRYTVTFDANGGEGTDPEAIANQLAGATVDMPTSTPLYNKEGHAFTGWKVINLSTEAEIEVENDQFVMPAANVKIQAQWAVVATCAVSFQVGGQEVATANAPQEADYNISQVGAAVPGFTFLGWSETEYADEVETAPTLINVYHAQAGEETKTLYGIYKRVEGAGESNHYVLDYATEGLADNTNWGAYTTAYDYTAADGGEWIIKAYKSSGMQINTNTNNPHIKVPNCPANIIQITLTCNSGAKKAVKFAETINGESLANGSENTTQTLELSEANVTTGYILPTANCQITYIDVAYDAEKTYYTSSPVEKVTITFDLADGEGGCQTTKINKGTQLTICDEVPTKSHSEFIGWKNGDDVYVAGTAYTFSEDITLTAQWNEAAKYTVTYAKGGDDVTGSVPTDNNKYFAGEQVTVLGQGGLEKSGYEFQGWLNGNKLYAEDATFAMPAENVTLTAQWRKENIAQVASEKMTLITDASGLINGTVVALGCSYGENSFAMAGEISNDVMASVTEGVSLSNGIATFTSSVVMMIAEQVEGGWTLRKDETNYLKETAVKKLAWGTEATVWDISFSEGNVVIANGSNKLQFNSGSPRFTTYSSAQTAIQLYGKAIVVTDDVNISDLGYVGEDQPIVASGQNVTLTIDEPTTTPSITAKNGATVIIDQATTAENVVVEAGSKIVANAETTTPTVYFATTMGVTDGGGNFQGVASELGSVTNITLATGGEIIYDLTLGTSQAGVQADPSQWHAFSLPFAVDALNGIYDAETGAKLENEVNYAIMDYHGDFRANGQYGWKKYRGILQPGVFYLMTVDGDTKTFRFKATQAGPMTQTNLMSAQAYDGTGADSDKGWNGFGNPRWIEGTFAHNAQYLDPFTYEYTTFTPGMTIPVGLPFFYKAATTSDVSMGEVGASYAPARNKAYEIKNVAVRFGNEVSKDKLYISASEDALNEYEQDKDLVKMFMSQTPKVARISGNAYGMKLCMVNAPMANDQATYSLTLYAPNAGEYTISAPEMNDADIYLTYNDAIVWNISMSEFTLDLQKGNNEGYGLILVKKAPQVTTGVDEIETSEAAQKVIIDEHVFILRGGKMYDVNGKMVK